MERRSTGLIHCRLCAAIFTSLDHEAGESFSGLAESAANLRASWLSSARWQLARKLQLKQRCVSPSGGSMRPYLILMAVVLMAALAIAQQPVPFPGA